MPMKRLVFGRRKTALGPNAETDEAQQARATVAENFILLLCIRVWSTSMDEVARQLLKARRRGDENWT
jgi:hypothetical protein